MKNNYLDNKKLITNEYGAFHKDVLEDFLNLKNAALKREIDLQILSSYRSPERQKEIWNAKASGKKVLLDDEGLVKNYNSLSELEIMFSILRWSALPGWSRHHLGTDFDLFDKNALPKNYEIQLIPSEYETMGIFENMTEFLNERILNNQSFSFYRPYQADLGGVAPELWHFSHYKIGQTIFEKIKLSQFIDSLNDSFYEDLLLIELIKENAKEIFERFIMNTTKAPWP